MNRDERIAAWLDRELTPAELAAFEADMAVDPALKAEAEAWRVRDAELRESFPPNHVDDAVLARLGLASADRPTAEIIDFSAARASKQRGQQKRPGFAIPQRWRLPLGGALAASVAAFFVIAHPGGSARDVNHAIQTAMQTLPSGGSVMLPDGRRMAVRLTVRAGDGRMCREYATSGKHASTGIACSEGGRWIVEARQAAADEQGSGGYRTAGGEDPSSLDDAYYRLKASDPLSVQEEKSLISKGWKK